MAKDSHSYSYWLGTFIVRGSVAPRVFVDVLIFGCVSIAIVIAIHFAQLWFGLNLSVAVGPLEAAGTVLGLLLVLRVNSGYSRWWEARVLWGELVSLSRNMAIEVIYYGPDDPQWRSRLIRWIAAFPHVVRRSLREQREFPELLRLISVDSRTWITSVDHMPSAVSSEIASMLREGRKRGLDGFAWQRLEVLRVKALENVGGCERILKTPLALSSVIQVRQFIFLLLVTLPFALTFDPQEASNSPSSYSLLKQICFVPLFVMLLAYPLLSLDRIGMELQQPFDTERVDFLPLDDFCVNIERDVLACLHDFESSQAHAPKPEDVTLPPDAKQSDLVVNADIS